MAQALTKEFERRLEKAGSDAGGITADEVLKRALKLYELALAADSVELVKGDVRQGVKL